jgi:hypothetical protein
MQRIIKKISIIILIAIFAVSPLRIDFFYLSQNVLADDEILEDIHISEDTTWNNSTDLSHYENIYVDWGTTLTIEKGAHLAFRHLYVYGSIIAIGTMEERIELTRIPPTVINRDPYDPICFKEIYGTIEFSGPGDYDDDPESMMEFVDFSEMGGYDRFDNSNCPGLSKQNKVKDLFFPTAYAAVVERAAPAIKITSGRITMKNCTFNKNEYKDIDIEMEEGDWNNESYVHIENSNFQNNFQNTAIASSVTNSATHDALFESCFNDCKSGYPDDYAIYGEICSAYCRNAVENDPSVHDKTKVILKNNWYGDASGPKTILHDLADGEELTGDFSMEESDWRWSADMASNVLFLPGIKASYLSDKSNDNQLWLPNNTSEVLDLKMDQDGGSQRNVYAKDVIENAYAISGIYDEFVEDLAGMKNGRIIKDYSLFAYDWRFDVENIAKNGTQYENEIKHAISEIERLQNNSVSQKVTIVAHSNGGLLAKAIMQELERQGKSNLVDNVVMVSSPQMGTPETIAALLHGYKQGLPKLSVFMDDADSRELTENMPGAYGLLPSEEYFSRNQESIIDFKTDLEPYKKYKDAYGEKIDDYAELRKFLLAKDDGRGKPSKEDLVNASVLNEKLFDQAREMHQRIDGWSPPEGIKLIQIAGWGLDTISGMEYSQKPHVECVKAFGLIPKCTETSLFDPIMEPKFTVDGDGTVVAPSSLMLENSERVERLWLDLYRYNKSYFDITIDRQHRDILEVAQLRELLSNIIKIHQSPEVLSRHISSQKPSDYTGMKPRIRMSLYSPLDIHLYDEDGNHTGPITTDDGTTIEENIPNTYYKAFGNQKYVGWSEDQDIRVELAGYAEGSYTVKLQEVSLTEDGEENGDSVILEDLPTTDKTQASFEVPEAGLKEMTSLEADYDGDESIDYSVEPKINSSSTLERSDSNDEQENSNNDGDEAQNDLPKEEKKEKARIDSWKAILSTKAKDKFCQQRLNLTINGRRFDDKIEIYIGNQKAKKVEKKSNKKLEAVFCLDKLLKKKTGLRRSISARNPETNKEYAGKKIDLNTFLTIKNK